jgi:OOP family OmpA-OmpF porin
MRRSLFILVAVCSCLAINPASVLAKDSDHDGVPDAEDRCPNTAMLSKVPADFKFAAAVNPDRLKQHSQAHPVDPHGCEFDTDGDGVINSQDYCPQDSQVAISKGVAENGCPKHSDADGTPDYRDRCPGTPAGTKTDRHGCEIH